MIEPDNLSTLLNFFDMGASTAENDPLLESAKIETQEFTDIYYYDRIDIIKGIKGSGKTAIYRLFYLLKDYFEKEKSIYCIFGIEATGDPIFRYYQNEYAEFSEIEFENFWNMYFVSLLYNTIYTNDSLKILLKADLSEVENIVSELGMKISKNGITIKDSIGFIQRIIKNKNIKVGISSEIDPSTSNISSITPLIELSSAQRDELSRKPMYIANFRERISKILETHNIRVWIMIDRLDEVFPHRSEIEKRGLRGLLKTSYNISNPNLRIKIFLREDIIGYLAADGFTALTHVTDRCSSTMSWSKDDLIYLIIKRVSFMAYCSDYFKIDKELVDMNKEYRESVFNDIFPVKIGKIPTMSWIYANCSDGNNIVTPRDVIDFFKFAKSEQIKDLKLNPKPQDRLFSEEVFKKAVNDLSKHKKETYLFAEFPHLKQYFLKFEGKCSEYDEASIQKILGPEYLSILEDLKSIGFIRYISKSNTYKIPIIWRKGLNIRRIKQMTKGNR